jgi:hypothetical protein
MLLMVEVVLAVVLAGLGWRVAVVLMQRAALVLIPTQEL